MFVFFIFLGDEIKPNKVEMFGDSWMSSDADEGHDRE